MNLIKKIKTVDAECIEEIVNLCEILDEWFRWNKYYGFKYKIISTDCFGCSDIIVIHNLWEGICYTISDEIDFVNDVIDLLQQDLDTGDKEDFNLFWCNRVSDIFI